MIYAYKIKNP